MNPEHEKKVFTVFKECLQVSDNVDRETLIYNETKNWDSIGHMSIIAGLEESFDCMMDTDEILDMGSFEKSLTIMEKYS